MRKIKLEEIEKIKNIWLKNREFKNLRQIFLEDLQEIFNESNCLSPEYTYFMRLVRKWKQEEEEKENIYLVKTTSDEEILKIQQENRKKTIILLSKLLKHYESHPKKLNKLDVGRLYQIIQGAEDAIKRTEVLMHKEKRETQRMILPYLRLSPEEILKLKEKLNESFDRILKLKSGGNS